jgi:hypothetical protein
MKNLLILMIMLLSVTLSAQNTPHINTAATQQQFQWLGVTKAHIDNNGTFVSGSDTLSKSKLVNRVYVGAKGQFTTISAAITWLKTHMTGGAEILLDGATFTIADSISINLPYPIVIRGMGTDATFINAATGLTGKPMFRCYSNVEFNRVYLKGSTLANWGTLPAENFIDVKGSSDFIELNNSIFDETFIGVRVFNDAELLVNYCSFYNSVDEAIGIYNSTATKHVFYEIRDTYFYYNNKSIEFASGDSMAFLITSNNFVSRPTDTAIYFKTAVVPNLVTSIINNQFSLSNFTVVGLDFSLQKYCNIYIRGNTNYPDATPTAKINVFNNTTATNITNVNTFYPAVFANRTNIVFNAAATGGTFTITLGTQTTGAIAYNANSGTMADNIRNALNDLSNVTATTVTSVTNQTEFSIQFTTADEGWQNMTLNIANLTSVTGYYMRGNTVLSKFTALSNKVVYMPTYSSNVDVDLDGSILCSNNGRSTDIAIGHYNSSNVLLGIYGATTSVIATAATPFSINAVLRMSKGDYLRIMLSKSTNAGETLTIVDSNWRTKY